MSTPSSNDPKNGGGQVAVDYVQAQLHHARVALRRVQIVAVILIGLLLCSMVYLNKRWGKELDPTVAANSAVEQVHAQVIQHADVLADDLKERVPAFIASLPDTVLEELPNQREAIETHVKSDIRDYCQRASKEMEKHLDKFLEDNKQEIVSALRSPDNKDAFKALGVHLQDEVVAFLSEKPEEGESIKEKIDHSMELLKRVEKHMERLASGKDLTPQEKKARRAVAIITHSIDKNIEKPVPGRDQ